MAHSELRLNLAKRHLSLEKTSIDTVADFAGPAIVGF